MFLGADIGGTKTNLAFFELKGSKLTMKLVEKYSSKDHGSLDEIVSDYLKKHKLKIKQAVFGIAGPVENEKAKATNLPWNVSAKALSEITGCPVHLINDLEANAWGIQVLKKSELYCLQKGKAQRGNRTLISAGTGLGEAGLYFHQNKHLPFACEGGHVDFAPTCEEEVELWRYLDNKFKHVSYERVLSGQGLENIYHFLLHHSKRKMPKVIEKQLKDKPLAYVVSEMGLHKKNALCEKALKRMVSIYGSAAGNLALKHMALNGLYIGGGIAPKILPVLKGPLFKRAFLNKGRFKKLLLEIPIFVILNDKTALLGSGQCALHLHQNNN